MAIRKVAPLVVGVVILTGSIGRAVGESLYVYKNPQGVEVIGQKGQTLGSKSVLITNDPADEEFWQFDLRINEGMVARVIGSKEKCEVSRNTVPRFANLSEPCRGPYYFKRVQ